MSSFSGSTENVSSSPLPSSASSPKTTAYRIRLPRPSIVGTSDRNTDVQEFVMCCPEGNWKYAFLAHLSTKCSWWAIVVSGCPSSCVVCRASPVNIWCLHSSKNTFAILFFLNLVRMFVLTISRPSSNIGHVGLKTRSPGQILWNSF